jgi:hypothetical protein
MWRLEAWMYSLIKMKRILLTTFILLSLVFGVSAQVFTGNNAYFGETSVSSSFYGDYRVYGSSVNPQFYNPNFFSVSGYASPEDYWSRFGAEDCLERQDFVMQIAPGGCSPAVVRSDLLEEQNVPVFCKVMAVQVNPLIDVTKIRGLRFKGDYPKGVSSISYFPARAAIRSQTSLVSSPLQDNLGYLVIVLSRQEIERDMPDFVEGNITAVIDYDVEGAFGIGNTNFYLSELGNDDWYRDYRQYGFWNGKAYIRADSIESDRATIYVYRDADTRQSTVTLIKGQTSNDIYLNGFYCAAGMNLKLEEISAPVESALIEVNGESMWVSVGDKFADDKCRIISLDTYGGGGRVSVSCSVSNGRFDLALNPGRASFNINGKKEELVVGQRIAGTENTYIGYIGKDSDKKDFIVLVEDEFSYGEYGFSDKEVYGVIEEIVRESKKSVYDLEDQINRAVKNQYKSKLKKIPSRDIEEKLKVSVFEAGSISSDVSLEEIFVAEDRVWDDANEQELLAKEYYEESIRYYEELADIYPNEKVVYSSDEDPYAAMALYEAAKLSVLFGMNEKANDLYSRLLREYPNSYVADKVKREKDLLMKYDSRESKALVYIDNEQYFIGLMDFKKPSKEEASATLIINGKEENLGLNEIFLLNDINGSSSIQVMKIDDDSITLRYSGTGFDSSYYYKDPYQKEDSKYNSYKTEILYLDKDRSQTAFGSVIVRLASIHLDKQAKIKITPKTFGPRTESNFKFKIGVEKRAIKLSPEQTRDLIDNLNRNIEEWNKINKQLGNVVRGLKAACFSTSAILTVKNFFEGAGGKSMARKKVMTTSGGWNEFCENQVSDGVYVSVEKCFLEMNNLIEKDVDIYQEEIENTNKIMEDIQKEVGVERSDILDFEGQVDRKKVEDRFEEKFDSFIRGASGNVTLSDGKNTSVSFMNDISKWDTLTHEQRRDIMTLYNTRESAKSEGGSEVLIDALGRELGDVTLKAKNYWEYQGAKLAAENKAAEYNLGLKPMVPFGDSVTYGDIKSITSGDSGHNVYQNFREGENVIRVFIPFSQIIGNSQFSANSEVGGKEVIIKVDQTENGVYTVDKSAQIYTVEGKALSQNATNSVLEYLGIAGLHRFMNSNNKAYENKMISPQDLRVKYFERWPYKGLPAEVPFDINKGWYVELTYVLSGFGKPYDDSGRALNFYVCNVGSNGMIEFKKSADDICRYYNAGTNADIDFPGMTSSESRQLLSRAQQAISEAARQYGQEKIRIGGDSFDSGISFGGEEGQCSDFMSPQDCNILFNVCDPVICPSSRCDLGGDFRVDNVIQTGIIGSLVLCLPNAKEGILVPICLTGVHAGIEGYVSILNSTVACLNESLETGRNIGICDEIKSIYICEFFWKQFTPFLNVIVPRIFESFYSQGVRGGGEYLTVKDAWDTTSDAISYFKNEYAVNSMLAFNRRSTEEIGGDVCKSFMSVNYPNSGSLFDSLIEPDSPVQFNAWFDENQLTSATIPSTSHYKVYYHIYAGRDQGASYVVYLKNPPESSQIYSSQIIVVDRGYIARGSQIDEARDLTATSGYTQLCVSVNGQEECDFGKVSTSYALNYLSDEYANEQLKTDITSEKECVAGTPSLLSLAQPNLQAGVEEAINPEIYSKGIIRICASENPGKTVLPNGEYDTTNSTYDKWKIVGYCDDPSIKCWLDTDSVKDVIRDRNIEENALEEVDLSVLGEIDYWTEDQSRDVLERGRRSIETLSVNQGDSKEIIESKVKENVNLLLKLTELGYDNVYRARGFYLLGQLYGKIAKVLLTGDKKEDFVPYYLNPDTLVEEEDLEPAPLPSSVEDMERWEEFYRRESIYNYLKVYQNGEEREILVDSLDMSSGRVVIDGEVKKAVIRNGRVELEEWKENSEDSSLDIENPVTEEDIQTIEEEDGSIIRYIRIYHSNLGRFELYKIINFDYKKQTVTFTDGSEREIIKDFQNRIVFSLPDPGPDDSLVV